MRTAQWIVLASLGGCYGQYDQGWDDGCYQGGLDGAMWGRRRTVLQRQSSSPHEPE